MNILNRQRFTEFNQKSYICHYFITMSENKSHKTENTKDQKTAFYDRLKEELSKNPNWPAEYMYKFIMPNEDENIDKIKEGFENIEINLKKNYSKTGKYISITIITKEKNPDAVIKRYKAMEDIEGLVAL